MAPANRPAHKKTTVRRLRTVTLIALAGGCIGLGLWTWRTRSLAVQVRYGVELLETVRTRAQVHAALDRWVAETRARWHSRQFDLIRLLRSEQWRDDPRARLLLLRVSGAEFDDEQDWQRWLGTAQRRTRGEPIRVPRGERVELEASWNAPVGLTGWFSTILPLDGQIFVASLGRRFAEDEDGADGVVRVDGRTGDAKLIFQPPADHLGLRDIIGIAAGDGCLFVGCHNGHVYCIDPTGESRWATHVGAPVVGAPLAIDLNRDGVTDVAVPTRAGHVVALSGRQGQTVWVAEIGASRPAGTPAVGATLLLTGSANADGRSIVATLIDGTVAGVAARSGEVVWRDTLRTGTLSGGVSLGRDDDHDVPAWFCDRAAQVWSLIADGVSADLVRVGGLGRARPELVVAALCTLDSRSAVPTLIVCPTGSYAEDRGAVAALRLDDVHWRSPVGGAVWATPAVADLNGNGRSEIAVASIVPTAVPPAAGRLTILSDRGHIVKLVDVPAAIECTPVVADVNGDGDLDILIADQAGVLHCLSTGSSGEVHWGLAAGDPHNTRNAANAYAFGQRQYGLQWDWKPE